MLERGAARIRTELQEPEIRARMLDSIGTAYTSIGRFDRASDILKESLQIREASGGGATLEAAATMSRIAAAARTPQTFPEGEQLAERALEIRRRLAGPRAVETAESLNTLGSMRYFYRGQNLEASRLFTEAIDIWQHERGPEATEVFNGFRNLILCWRERAEYLKAERIDPGMLMRAERAERELLANRRKALGETHGETGRTMASLAMMLHFSGRDREAEPLLRESIVVRTKAYGRRDHSSPLESIHNLAIVLHDQGRLDEAEPLYREVVQSFRSALGVHAHLAININNLATVLEDEQKWDEAETAYREAIAIRRQTLGADQPGVARTLHNLARLMRERGRPAEGLPIVDEALAIRRAKLGDSDFETATSKVLKGSILAMVNRRPEAEPLLREALAAYRAVLPPQDSRIADVERRLAELASRLPS
jgi:tetratricopeptide (TPR) repeat protein